MHKEISQIKAKIPFSRGGDKLVYTCQDQYGKILVVDAGKQRILNFDSPFEQSCMWLPQPTQLVHQYTQLMLLSIVLSEPRHITLFGLGGGSLLRTIHHVLPNSLYHVVELREAVLDVATTYFEVPNDERVRVSIGNALSEVFNIKSRSTDIILSDMYDAYRMVPGQLHSRFLKECARILNPNGILVLNLHSSARESSKLIQELTFPQS